MQRERRGKCLKCLRDAILAFQVKLTYFFSFKGEEISLMKTKTFHENKKGKNIFPLILFKKKSILHCSYLTRHNVTIYGFVLWLKRFSFLF